MIFSLKSYSNRLKIGISGCQSFRVKGNLLASFTFVGIHYFDIPLSGGDTLVCHDALYGADVRSGSCL